MTPGLRRVWWAMGAVLVALVGWLVRSGMAPVEPPPAVARPVPTFVSTAAPVVDASGSATIEPSGAVLHGSDEIELCGGLWVKLKDDGNIDVDDFKRVVRLSEARAQMLDALRADSSEFARAAAIRLALVGSEPPPLPEGATTCEPAQCEVQRQYAARSAEARDALVQMATTTRNPQVYALAFNVCGATPNEASCRLLSAEQWARLDPDNAAPWMFVLTQAAQRRDMAAQGEALHRLATSVRSDPYLFAMTGQVLAHSQGDEASMSAAATLALEASGVELAWPIPGYQSLVPLCKGAALRDANRRQTCDAVAELFVARSSHLLERTIGVRLGSQLGWPDERVDRLRGEFAAYGASLAGDGSALNNTCAATRRGLELLERNARLGEAGALRAWVAQSGKMPEDFIRTEREGQVLRAAEAASFAAAASAASASR